MGLEKVVQEILEEGEQEAEAIRAEAQQEADAILEDARKEAEGLKQKMAKQAQATAEDRARRIEASAQLEAKKKRLEAESDVLASVRSRAEDAISNLDADERAQLMSALIEDANATELGKGAKAWGRKEDKDAIEQHGFTFAGERDCLGGVVIENTEGTMREDLRFETVLDRVWRETAHDIATSYLE